MATTSPQIAAELRDEILARPDVLLDDKDVMRALVAAHEKTNGGNVVDLRGIAMARLEDRLDRLEDTHRTVIAAAYENLAGTNQVHRAILRMLDPRSFEDFLRDLQGEVADILRVDVVRLVLESVAGQDAASARLGDVLTVVEPGFVEDYLDTARGGSDRVVILRQVQPDSEAIYGDTGNWIGSEACLRLDFGEGRLPGMLVMGSEDPHQFAPTQGTDLMTFFAGVFERSMRTWLG
ncbi:MAG: DUF484 family protein [Pseudomonadota bacterium]